MPVDGLLANGLRSTEVGQPTGMDAKARACFLNISFLTYGHMLPCLQLLVCEPADKEDIAHVVRCNAGREASLPNVNTIRSVIRKALC